MAEHGGQGGGGSLDVRIRRALSEDFGNSAMDLDERGQPYAGPFPRDARVLAVTEPRARRAEGAHRWLLTMSKGRLARNPIYVSLLNTHRTSELAARVMERADIVTTLSLTNPDPHRADAELVPYADQSPEESFWGYFEELGRLRQGQTMEIVGPTGSGKTSFAAWAARKAIARGHDVWSSVNVDMNGVFPERGRELGVFHEVHRLSDALLSIIQRIRGGWKGIGFLIADEQTANLGSSSMTTNTLEGRWAKSLGTKIRKLQVNWLRLRQADDLPALQAEWVGIWIRKRRDPIDMVYGHYGVGATRQGKFQFRVHDYGAYFDSSAPSEFAYELDMEEFSAYVAEREGKGDYLEAMEEAVRAQVGERKVEGAPPGQARPDRKAREPPREPNTECSECHWRWAYTPKGPPHATATCPSCHFTTKSFNLRPYAPKKEEGDGLQTTPEDSQEAPAAAPPAEAADPTQPSTDAPGAP